MKKIFIFIFILCYSNILTSKPLDYHLEVYGSLQVNYPTDSQVTSCPSRVRLQIDTSSLNRKYFFTGRIIAATGKIYFGSTKTLVPANDVSIDSLYTEQGKSNIVIDKSFFTFLLSSKTSFYVGLIDPFTFNDQTGFTYSTASLNENMGFISPHFQKLYANNGLDQFKYISIPAVFFTHDFSMFFKIRWGITAGLTDKHIFIRNSFPFEIELNLFKNYTRFLLNIGMADADSSLVHKVSPSIGLIWDQKIKQNLMFFCKASKVFEDIKTWKTPGNHFRDNYKVAKEFSDFEEHYNFGITYGTDKCFTGCGISYLKSFFKNVSEKNIEVFIRIKLDEELYLTPDSQIVLNPNGVTKKDYNLLWLGALRLYYYY